MDTKEISIAGIFNKDGILKEHMPRYEYRETQVQMAQAINKVLEAEEYLIIEAGTGVGKSIAYLVPAVIWAVKNGKKIVISTNTINLQEQLVYKDIPLLGKIIPYEFSAVLVKGRNNYLCLRKFQRALDDEYDLLVASEFRDELEQIKKWVKKTQDGSLADINNQPSQQLWDEVCCELDNCLGKKCPYFAVCFFQKARAKIFKADVLIVNHHLCFSDLALRQMGKNILPGYDAVIFDEAHTVEQIATEHFGIEISNFGIKYLLNKLYNPKANRGILMYLQESAGIKIVLELHRIADSFFEKLYNILKKQESGILRPNSGDIPDVFGPNLIELHKELKKIKEKAKNNLDAQQELSTQIRRVEDLLEKLSAFRNQTLLGHVYWIELEAGKHQRMVMQAYPVIVGHYLKMNLFDIVKTVIFTGATLSVNKSFEYFKKRIGMEEIEELRLGSGFDYAKQMKVYVPSDMPSPKQIEAYKTALADKILKYLDYTGGKAFVLFTNNKLMREIYEKVSPALIDKGINTFIQGDGLSKHRMLEKFREDINSVLFGTDSFWTGVDVEGEALSNVIITRLPFAVPDHPLTKARIEFIEENEGNAFMDYSLPQAILKLRQGVGRLIRSKTDKGIIVILDNRIITSFYGKHFFNSLPDCPKIIE